MRTLYKILSLSFFLCSFVIGKEKSVLVTVENPTDIDRKSETVSLSLKDLTQRLKPIDVNRLVVLDAKTGTLILSQLTEDRLLFQSDFGPDERKEFAIKQTNKETTKPQSLVDGRFELPREDYAWENDRVAFRMYGPALAAEVNNGIDVWTKRVKYLIVDKWYSASAAAGKDTYHEDHGEGADFFSVGKTLGAGGTGIWLNGKVYQPGVFSTQKTICNGPIRVTFELTYSNWNIDGKKFTERKRISLDAGQSLNKVEVTFEGLEGGDSLSIACGLVKRGNTKISTDEEQRWMGLWGLTNGDSVNGFLGTAVIVPESAFFQFADDRDQYLIIGKTKANEPFTYYAGAGWSKSSDFTTENDWNSYLRICARKLRKPLKLSIRPR